MSLIVRLLFIFLYPSWSIGQDFHYRTIDKNNGLPSNEIYDLFQDKKGFIWIAHSGGLSKYDGYECKNYWHLEQSSRSGTNIQEDKFGRIWYQNFDGKLYFVFQDSIQVLAQNPSLGYIQFALDDNYIYAHQKKGIDLFDLKTLSYSKTIKLNIDLLHSFFAKGKFYLSLKDSLLVLDDKFRLKSYPYPLNLDKDLPIITQTSLHCNIAVSKFNSSQKCYELDSNGYSPKFDLAFNSFIQNISSTPEHYWFCTPSGVYAYSHKGEALNKEQPYFKNKNISVVLQDRENNFWFGTKGSGLLFVADLKSKTAFEQIPIHKMLYIDSSLYIGSLQGGLYKANLHNYSIQQIYQNKDRHEITILDYDSLLQRLLISDKNLLSLSTSGKVKDEWIIATKAATRINEKYYAFAASGTLGLSLQAKQETAANEWDKIYNKYSTKHGLINAQFSEGIRGKSLVYNQHSKAIYFSSSSGLLKVTPDTLYHITKNDSSLFLQKLCLVGQDIYAFDTNGHLQKIDAQENITTIDLGLVNKRITKLKQEQDFLLVLAEDELLFLNLKQPQLGWKKSYLNHVDIIDFILWEDQLILANKEGLLIQKFEPQATRTIAPILHLNGIKVNNLEIIDDKQLLNLRYDQNNIEIQYSILSFKTKSNFSLYYQINNNSWELAPSETRLLKLVALSPNFYTIKFSLGSPNNKDYPIQSIQFQILPPWWQQWWFWLLCTVLISSLTYAYYRQQTNMLIQQNKLLSEKIELEQNLSNSTLKAIKSQMNPHFFYNALNTIQSFIYSDDKKNASAYLSKFSKLTRMVLEMSEKEKILLSEEIDALKLYLEIEKVRFNDNFEYGIILDKNIDKELIKIPSMLIQPYVENAIKHGLLHQKERKKLTIDFEQEDNFLKVTIYDNGIGRKKSEELNKIKNSKHLSFSSDANATRLAILNRDNHQKTGIKYIDHLDEYQQSLGTTVILHIPIK